MIKYSNNAVATLAAGITNTATSISVASTQGSLFPTLGAGDYFYATLIDSSNNLEIVKVTARAGDTLTVSRGQEGTTARAYAAGDKLELRPTAQSLLDLITQNILQGTGIVLTKSGATTSIALGTSGVTAGSIGGSTAIPIITFDAYGRITGVSSASNPPPFPAGTLMLFQQTAAPTGWTKQTTHNDKALRVVSGSVSSGGSVAFSTAMASQTPSGSVNTSGLSVGATTLSTAQMPSHGHAFYCGIGWSGGPYLGLPEGTPIEGSASYNRGSAVGANGSGGSHSHALSGSATFSGNAINLAVQYVDLIIAAKD